MFGPTLAIGRIVNYVMQPSDFGPTSVYTANSQGRSAPIVRPAVIVETWGNQATSDETKWTVNLQVFVDGSNDGYPILPTAPAAGLSVQDALNAIMASPPPVCQLWKTSVTHNEATKVPGTWH
jgi:hypothetical protein